MTAETDAGVRYRAASLDDLPSMEDLLSQAGLPARYLAEFIDGFMVAETDGRVVACGGFELHDDAAVLRSVAVAEDVRGSGVGDRLSRLLIEDAKRRGARDAYLFTGDSHTFWQRLGFVELPMEQWREPAQRCWQYVYIRDHPDFRQRYDLHSMWLPLNS
jgi:amino-acid N-acetyltransferase